jgi:hypothetical protein
MSDDQLMLALQYLAILLFLSAGVLPLARSRYAWAKWAKWGAITIFSVAIVFALLLVVRWALGGNY